MPIKINQNIFSLIVQRNLSQASKRLEDSYEQLSSGQRINRASDDPSGLAASEQIRYEISGLRQSQQNVNGSFSLLGAAESQLNSMVDMLQRARELCVEGANDTLNATDRQSIQYELNELLGEINRVASTAKLNDQYLLNGQLRNVRIQTGTKSGDIIPVTLDDYRTASLGSQACKFSDRPVSGAALTAGAVLINGQSVPASKDDGVSTVLPAASAIAKAKAINDIETRTGVHADVQPTQVTGTSPVQPLTLNGTTNVLRINGVSINPVTIQPGDAGRTLIQAINTQTGVTGVTARLSATGTLELTAQDGRNIEIVTQGGIADELGLRTGNGDVNMVAMANLKLTSTHAFTLSDAGGLLGMNAAMQQVAVDPATALQHISVNDAAAATAAIKSIDAALTQVSDARSTLGSLHTRLETLGDTLAQRLEDLSSADSRIRDTDYALESTRLTQSQILQEAATAMLAQANITPRKALELLRQ